MGSTLTACRLNSFVKQNDSTKVLGSSSLLVRFSQECKDVVLIKRNVNGTVLVILFPVLEIKRGKSRRLLSKFERNE